MANLLNAHAIGNLTRDCETRNAGSTTVTKFGMAINEKRGKHEYVTFLDVECWGARGETLASYIGKGDAICVFGSLRNEDYESRDGQKRSKLVLNADGFTFLGGKRDGEQQQGGNARPARQATRPQQQQEDEPAPFDDDGSIDPESIPF